MEVTSLTPEKDSSYPQCSDRFFNVFLISYFGVGVGGGGSTGALLQYSGVEEKPPPPRSHIVHAGKIYVTCSAIWGLLDKDDDLRASHELLNTERIL